MLFACDPNLLNFYLNFELWSTSSYKAQNNYVTRGYFQNEARDSQDPFSLFQASFGKHMYDFIVTHDNVSFNWLLCLSSKKTRTWVKPLQNS